MQRVQEGLVGAGCTGRFGRCSVYRKVWGAACVGRSGALHSPAHVGLERVDGLRPRIPSSLWVFIGQYRQQDSVKTYAYAIIPDAVVCVCVKTYAYAIIPDAVVCVCVKTYAYAHECRTYDSLKTYANASIPDGVVCVCMYIVVYT